MEAKNELPRTNSPDGRFRFEAGCQRDHIIPYVIKFFIFMEHGDYVNGLVSHRNTYKFYPLDRHLPYLANSWMADGYTCLPLGKARALDRRDRLGSGALFVVR